MVIFAEMIENAVKSGRLDAKEKKRHHMKEGKRNLSNFPRESTKQRLHFIPYNPSYSPYYPTINIIALTSYFYKPPRSTNPPIQAVMVTYMVTP